MDTKPYLRRANGNIERAATLYARHLMENSEETRAVADPFNNALLSAREAFELNDQQTLKVNAYITASQIATAHDKTTAEILKHVEGLLLSALRTMPNHIDSVFDPKNDVPALETALDRVRLVKLSYDAQTQMPIPDHEHCVKAGYCWQDRERCPAGAPPPIRYPDPPEDLREAWEAFQAGGEVDGADMRALDEWRADVHEQAFQETKDS